MKLGTSLAIEPSKENSEESYRKLRLREKGDNTLIKSSKMQGASVCLDSPSPLRSIFSSGVVVVVAVAIAAVLIVSFGIWEALDVGAAPEDL